MKIQSHSGNGTTQHTRDDRNNIFSRVFVLAIELTPAIDLWNTNQVGIRNVEPCRTPVQLMILTHELMLSISETPSPVSSINILSLPSAVSRKAFLLPFMLPFKPVTSSSPNWSTRSMCLQNSVRRLACLTTNSKLLTVPVRSESKEVSTKSWAVLHLVPQVQRISCIPFLLYSSRCSKSILPSDNIVIAVLDRWLDEDNSYLEIFGRNVVIIRLCPRRTSVVLSSATFDTRHHHEEM